MNTTGIKEPGNRIHAILNRKFWIFDLDGTLTVAVHDFPAIRRTLKIPEGEDILKFIIAQEKSLADKMLQTLNDIEIDLAEHSKPAAGVVDLISLLHKNGAQLGVITRNTRENAKRSLSKIGILAYFTDASILGRMDAPPKPDPGGISQLLSLWNTSPDQAVMVGDFLFDLQAGKSAGTATIHVDAIEKTTWESLTDIHVNSLQELVELFPANNDTILYEN